MHGNMNVKYLARVKLGLGATKWLQYLQNSCVLILLCIWWPDIVNKFMCLSTWLWHRSTVMATNELNNVACGQSIFLQAKILDSHKTVQSSQE